MSEDSTPGRGPDPTARKSAMVGWLGFFLLVFAVAGLALYFTGPPQKAPENPAAVTQKAE